MGASWIWDDYLNAKTDSWISKVSSEYVSSDYFSTKF